MYRILPILLLVLGCAGNRFAENTQDEIYEFYVNDYYRDVVGQCAYIRSQFIAQETLVDCEVNGKEMHLNLPSQQYHDDMFNDIAVLYEQWCSAAAAKLGDPVIWMFTTREEGLVYTVPCLSSEPQI